MIGNFVIMKVNNHQLPGNPPRTSFSYRRLITRGPFDVVGNTPSAKCKYQADPVLGKLISWVKYSNCRWRLGLVRQKSRRSTPCVRFAPPLLMSYQECVLSRLFIHHRVLESCGLNSKSQNSFIALRDTGTGHRLFFTRYASLYICFPIIPV